MGGVTYHTYADWLAAGTPFKPGIRLYWALGGREARYDAIFNEWPVSMDIRARLKDDIRVLSSPIEERIEHSYIIPESIAAETTAEPFEIRALRQQARQLHKRQDMLFYTMQAGIETQNDEERFEIAKEIMETIIPALDETYMQIRRWQKNGQLPSVAAVADATDGNMRTILSIRSRISRLRGKIAAGGSTTEIDKWSIEITEKQQKLKELTDESQKPTKTS